MDTVCYKAKPCVLSFVITRNNENIIQIIQSVDYVLAMHQLIKKTYTQRWYRSTISQFVCPKLYILSKCLSACQLDRKIIKIFQEHCLKVFSTNYFLIQTFFSIDSSVIQAFLSWVSPWQPTADELIFFCVVHIITFL